MKTFELTRCVYLVALLLGCEKTESAAPPTAADTAAVHATSTAASKATRKGASTNPTATVRPTATAPTKATEPAGTPLFEGAPAFEHVTAGELRKIKRAKPLSHVSPAKRGVYWIQTVHAATDEQGARSYGNVLTKAFFTEKAAGELAIVAEGRPDPNAQDRMVALMKFVYQRTEKGKFRGDFQLVAKKGLMQKSPQPLRHAQLLVTSRRRKYKDANGRYTITAKPVGLQDITVYKTLYKDSLKMRRTWTQRIGNEVVDAREVSWWAPGVGEVAKLARFRNEKGSEATWTITLLKHFGETKNPHTLTKFFRQMTAGEVTSHNIQSAEINRQLETRRAKDRPSEEEFYLLGQTSQKAAAYLKRIFYLERSGPSKVTKMRWGRMGVIPVRSQLHRCPPRKGCGYDGIMLFSNAKTGRVVGGLTNLSVRYGLPKLANRSLNFFKLIVGPEGAERIRAKVPSALRRGSKLEMIIAKGKLNISQSSNRQSWAIAVSVP